MLAGYARVSTQDQNLELQHHRKPIAVSATGARNANSVRIA